MSKLTRIIYTTPTIAQSKVTLTPPVENSNVSIFTGIVDGVIAVLKLETTGEPPIQHLNVVVGAGEIHGLRRVFEVRGRMGLDERKQLGVATGTSCIGEECWSERKKADLLGKVTGKAS
ncbi:hypothetical protein HK096_010353, partial [Nowakowskiella sp. JEL0078]